MLTVKLAPTTTVNWWNLHVVVTWLFTTTRPNRTRDNPLGLTRYILLKTSSLREWSMLSYGVDTCTELVTKITKLM